MELTALEPSGIARLAGGGAYPDVFCAALINAQPMGFYAPPKSSPTPEPMELRSGRSVSIVREGIARSKRLREPTAMPCASGCVWSGGCLNRMLQRGDEPFVSIDDIWRRACVSSASLVKLAEADAFRPALKLERRDALWAIKALRDEPLPFFAADRERAVIAEQQEPDVTLRQMTEGQCRRGLWPYRRDTACPSGQLPARGSHPPKYRHLRRGDIGARRSLADDGGSGSRPSEAG